MDRARGRCQTSAAFYPPKVSSQEDVSSTSFNATETTVKKLPNGVTLIVAKSGTSTNVATVGVWLKVGSAIEPPQDNGVVHFLEHMTFKGTKKRSKVDLEKYIEQKGAHMNAYTTKEYVAYFSNCLSHVSSDMLELILEILTESNLSAPSVEEEKSVILRELEEVENIGEEALFDRIHAQVFPSSSMGRTILGSPSHIQRMTRNRLVKFVNKHYTPQNMIIVAAGDVDVEEIERIAAKLKPKRGSLTNSGHKEMSSIRFQAGMECFIEPSFDPVLEGPVLYIAQSAPTVSWSDPQGIHVTLARAMLSSDASNEDIEAERAFQSSRARVPSTLESPMTLKTPVFFDAYYRDTGLAGWYLLYPTRDLEINESDMDNASLFTNSSRMEELKKKMEECMNDAREMSAQRVTERIANWTTEHLQEAKNGLLSIYDQTYDTSGSLCEEFTRQYMTRGRLLSPQELEEEVSKVVLDDVKEIARKVFTPNKDECAITGFLRIPVKLKHELKD